MEMCIRDWQLRWQAMPCGEAALEKWLLIHTAPVIFADKAGELLAIPTTQFPLTRHEITQICERFASDHKVKCRNMPDSGQSYKLIIYAPERVHVQLANTPPCTLCDKLGYCVGIEPEEFLSEVAQRWQQSGDVPHEIGLALGYPVKDVLGFMGLNQLPCTGCFGWRVYGDPTPSRQASHSYQVARTHAERLAALATMPNAKSAPARIA